MTNLSRKLQECGNLFIRWDDLVLQIMEDGFAAHPLYSPEKISLVCRFCGISLI